MRTRTRQQIGLIAMAAIGIVLFLLAFLKAPSEIAPVLPFAALGAGAVVYAAFARRKADAASPPPSQPAALGGMLLGIVAGFSLLTLWTGGEPGSSWKRLAGIPIVIAGTFAFSWLARRLAGGLHGSTQPHRTGAGRLVLGEDEQAVWSGSATQPFLVVLSAAVVLIGLVVALAGQAWPGLLAAVIGVIIGATFARIRVIVDRTGLTIRYAPSSWPSTHVDLADIEQVSVIDVRPIKWGGWGYRGSLRALGHAAVVVRRGPGIRLDLTKNRTFVVTVDHPEPAAELLQAELRRQASAA